MTDVVEIAKQRIATLAAEIGTLDSFIRMAEKLMTDSKLTSSTEPETDVEKALGSAHTAIARLFSEGTGDNDPSGANGANGAGGAEAEREDLPVRELTAQERQH